MNREHPQIKLELHVAEQILQALCKIKRKDNAYISREFLRMEIHRVQKEYEIQYAEIHKEDLIKLLIEIKDRLQMGQDRAGNSSINAEEIEMICKTIAKAEGK